MSFWGMLGYFCFSSLWICPLSVHLGLSRIASVGISEWAGRFVFIDPPARGVPAPAITFQFWQSNRWKGYLILISSYLVNINSKVSQLLMCYISPFKNCPLMSFVHILLEYYILFLLIYKTQSYLMVLLLCVMWYT